MAYWANEFKVVYLEISTLSRLLQAIVHRTLKPEIPKPAREEGGLRVQGLGVKGSGVKGLRV